MWIVIQHLQAPVLPVNQTCWLKGGLNNIVRDLNLSKKQAELLGSRVKGWNLLRPGYWGVNKLWPKRTSLTPGEKNVVNPPLVLLDKIYLPPSHIKLGFMTNFGKGQMKHQLDATLCRFYFCRVTRHVSGESAHHQEYLKLVQRPLVHVLSLQVSHLISLLGPFRP